MRRLRGPYTEARAESHCIQERSPCLINALSHVLTPQQQFILDQVDLNLTASIRMSTDAQVVCRDGPFPLCRIAQLDSPPNRVPVPRVTPGPGCMGVAHLQLETFRFATISWTECCINAPIHTCTASQRIPVSMFSSETAALMADYFRS